MFPSYMVNLAIAKAGNLPENYLIVTIVFTSQQMPTADIAKIPDSILVIEKSNFKDYYGPFANRAWLSLAATLNPNFADL